MASTQAVWGLDLGRCSLKAIKLRPTSDDKVEIVAHDIVEHAKILSQPDADRNELIASALEKFLSRNDVSKDFVVVGVPGQHTLARFTKLPPVAAKRIPDIVRYEADQQIPFDMDEVIWDFQTFQQEGSPDLEVGIFAMKRELIREHLLHFEQAAIEPIAVQCGPLAVYNAAVFDGMLGDETTILVDVGAENADLIIATKDSFWTRTVPIGGNNFTEALVKSFKLSFSKAESLKRTASTSKYTRQIFQAMRPVFADLVQELQRSMGFYGSTHRDAKIEKVVFLGSAGKLPGLRKYLQQNLGLTVERPEEFAKAVFAAGTGGDSFKEDLPGFAVAYGLAIQGLDLGQVTSNLLPTEIAKQVVWKKKRPAFAASAACLLIAGGLIWFRYSADMSALAAGTQSMPPTPTNVEEAWDVITRGASGSDRGQAQAILAAGQVMKRASSELDGQGDAERMQTEDLIALQENKLFISRLLELIHESVPRPSGAVGQASSAQELRTALQQDALPRDERNRVHIEALDMQFKPNLNAVEWETRVPVPDPINDPDADFPGMMIEITCRSAHKDGQEFIRQGFMKNLRRNSRKPGNGFYFDRVYLFSGAPVENIGVAATSVAPLGGGNPGGGRGGFATAAPAAPVGAPRFVDPITNETIKKDWRYVIWVDVIPEEFPAEEGDGESVEEGD